MGQVRDSLSSCAKGNKLPVSQRVVVTEIKHDPRLTLHGSDTVCKVTVLSVPIRSVDQKNKSLTLKCNH